MGFLSSETENAALICEFQTEGYADQDDMTVLTEFKVIVRSATATLNQWFCSTHFYVKEGEGRSN